MGIPGIVARQTQVGVEEWEKHMARHKQTHGLHTNQTKFLDALASLDLKLSVSQSLSDSPFSSIKASASTGLSELLYVDHVLNFRIYSPHYYCAHHHQKLQDPFFTVISFFFSG